MKLVILMGAIGALCWVVTLLLEGLFGPRNKK